jgi:crossover junction endodeoxyribonuclease RuvC
MVFLGVDPGSSRTGFGLLSFDRGSFGHMAHGVINTGCNSALAHRLEQIYGGIQEVIRDYRPDGVAVESIFHARNARSSLILGHARGVVLLASIHCGVNVYEYSPLEVKQALSGYGRAGKEQIRSMVRAILTMDALPPLDASDALAVAICHAHFQQHLQRVRMTS